MTQLNFARQLTLGQYSQNLFTLSKFRYYKTCLRCQSKTSLKVLRTKTHLPVTICGCTCSLNVFRLKSILIKCESQELHNVSQQHSKNVWVYKIVKRAQSIFTKFWSQECLFAWHTNRENAPRTSFCTPCRRRTPNCVSTSQANSFVLDA